MTWAALFTSWQFWLVIFLNTSFSTVGGMWLIALMQANERDEPEPPPVDLSLEIAAMREENRRLTEANFALNLQNAALERELNALDSGFADYGTEQRLDEAADGRRT